MSCLPALNELLSDQSRTLVLLSGGIDSAVLLLLLLAEGADCEGLYVDYGQPSGRAELVAAEAIARHAGVSLQTVTVAGVLVAPGEIPGRNRMLASLGFMASAARHAWIALGIHGGTGYSDCSPAFVNAMQRSFDVDAAGRVRMLAPFVDVGKADIVRLGAELNVPLASTWSCEASGQTPCGACLSCLDRGALGVPL